jgi:YidC/Oxa1 family membrane protein insertase
LVEFQAFSGLPWWATIAFSTVLVKTALIPIVRLQIIASQQYAKAIPEISFLNSLLRKNLFGNSQNTQQKLEAIKSYYRGYRASLVIHNASVLPLVAYPLVNVSVFVTFILSVRDLIEADKAGILSEGGLWWFEDLIATDATYVLPFAAVGCSYIGLEVAFQGGAGPYVPLLRHLAQTFMIFVLPITATLPCGVFCYWIPSSLYGMTQTLLLRQPVVMKALRIPLVPKPSDLRIPE